MLRRGGVREGKREEVESREEEVESREDEVDDRLEGWREGQEEGCPKSGKQGWAIRVEV